MQDNRRACAGVRRSDGGSGDADLLGVDLLEARSLRAARELTLGSVPLGKPKPWSSTDLLGDRHDPLDQPLDSGAGGQDIATLEVDQLTGKPDADRPPRVLLDQTAGVVRKRLAFVVAPEHSAP